MAWATDKTSIGTLVTDLTYGNTSLAYTLNQTVASNAWIFCGIMSYFSDTVSTATDNGPGLAWTVNKYSGTADANHKIAIIRAFAPAGMASGTVITANWTAGDTSNKAMAGSSFTGGDASSFDVAAAGASANSVNWASTNLTTAQDNELLVGVGRFANGASGTPVGTTVELFENVTTGDTFYMVYKFATTAGSYNVAGTFGFADNWCALAIAMKVAAAVGVSDVSIDTLPSAARISYA